MPSGSSTGPVIWSASSCYSSQDAAYTWRDEKGKVRVPAGNQSHGRWGGQRRLVGHLIGLIFLNPLAGLAVGAATVEGGRGPEAL
jgi:uncharacterized membrane protein